MQQLIAGSTMESEYIAMSTACKDLFPLMDLVHELGRCLGVPIADKSNLHVRVHEDNAKSAPPQKFGNEIIMLMFQTPKRASSIKATD